MQYTRRLNQYWYDILAREPVSLTLQARPSFMLRLHSTLSTVLLIAASCCSIGLWWSLFSGSILLMWVIGLLIITTVASGFRFVQSSARNISEPAFLVLLIVVTIVPRLWWITHAGTVPVADFAGYQDYAVSVSSGDLTAFTPVMTVFPFKFFYPLVLGALYWLTTPSAFIAQQLNLVLSVIIALQVYRLGYRAGGEHCGRLAAVLFALWPSQIAFCSVVAQEHLFQVFFLGAILLLLRSQDSASLRTLIMCGALAGAAIAIAHALRPVALVVFPTLLAFVLWGTSTNGSRWKLRLSLLGSSLAGFVVVLIAIMLPTATAVTYPVWKSSAGFSLYVGTSTASRGFWSAKHAEILDEYSNDFDAVHRASTDRAVQSIVDQPGDFLELVATKFVLFWGSDDYGVYFSTVEQLPTADAVSVYRHRNRLNLLAQGAYAAIILSAAVGMYRMRSTANGTLLVIQSVFLLHVVAFSVLEIQSRYHFLVVPLLMIPAAMAWLPHLRSKPA